MLFHRKERLGGGVSKSLKELREEYALRKATKLSADEVTYTWSIGDKTIGTVAAEADTSTATVSGLKVGTTTLSVFSSDGKGGTAPVNVYEEITSGTIDCTTKTYVTGSPISDNVTVVCDPVWNDKNQYEFDVVLGGASGAVTMTEPYDVANGIIAKLGGTAGGTSGETGTMTIDCTIKDKGGKTVATNTISVTITAS